MNKRMLAGAMAALGALVSLLGILLSYGITALRGDSADMNKTLHEMQIDSMSIKSDVRNLYTRLDDEVIKQMQAQALTIASNRAERMQQLDEVRARIKALEEVQAGHRTLK